MATEEVDELAESILDCIMNSHFIPSAGMAYVESFIPTKPQAPDAIKIDLYERVEKEKSNKMALIFKSHAQAKQWYAETRASTGAAIPQRIAKKTVLIENVVFAYTEGAKQISSYVEFISEFIETQAICVLQHLISEKELFNTEDRHFFYQIHWEYKGFLPQSYSLHHNDLNKYNDDPIPMKSIKTKTEDYPSMKLKSEETLSKNKQQPLPQVAETKNKQKQSEIIQKQIQNFQDVESDQEEVEEDEDADQDGSEFEIDYGYEDDD